HVSHRRAEARTEPARARRAPVPARVPRVEVELRQIELVDQVGHAPGVLVTAMKERDRAARRSLRRRPMPVEKLGAVKRTEQTLGGFSLHDRTSRRPLRIRVITVSAASAAMAHIAHPAQAGSGERNTIHSAKSEKTNARSLFPIGPS